MYQDSDQPAQRQVPVDRHVQPYPAAEGEVEVEAGPEHSREGAEESSPWGGIAWLAIL